jgi:hypothetical protein
MKDLRFTGHINADYIDVTLRTDMIGATDTNFNITQIQEGPQFDTIDSQGGMFLKYFSGAGFKRINCTYVTAYNFAVNNGLDLRMINADGTSTTLIHNFSLSTSAYN